MVQYYPMEILYKNITHTHFSESILQVLMDAELPGKQMQELFRALITTQQLVWEDHWPNCSCSIILSLVINTHLACCILMLYMPNYGGLILHSSESRINYCPRQTLNCLTATILNEDKADYPKQPVPKARV